MRTAGIAALAAAAWLGFGLSPAAAADASGVATSGSAGATPTLPGPDSQPGTGETPARLNLGQGAAAGAGGITEEQVRRSLEAAGYTDVEIARQGGDWVAKGKLNGATQRLRIDPKTGQAKP